MQFSDLELDPNVLKAVEEAGYTVPTPIQEQAIPHALSGRDVLGIAQTGTGKTAGFTLPMITMLARGRARARMPRSLILCPTRELAAQVAENFETYGKYHKLSMALLIGGVSFKDQDKLIDRGVDVLIATPGRLLDHFERGKLMLTGVQIMVVDEADRMLDMGFIPDIERIFKLTPFTRQTLFFSATMPPEITRITETFLHNPVRVEVARQATAAETVQQRVCRIHTSRHERGQSEKRDALRMLLEQERAAEGGLKNAIIFCNRKRDVGVLQRSLVKRGYNAGALHGDLDQSVRTATLNGFRDGSITFLVASDVAARGLDIPAVSHIINYDVPIHCEDYIHRIGRTGRAGLSGKALTLATPADDKYLDRIEKMLGHEIEKFDASPVAPATKEAEETERPSRARGRRKDEPKAAEAHQPRQATEAPQPRQATESRQPAPEASQPAPEPRREEPQRQGRDRRPEPAREPAKGKRRGKGDHHGGQVIGMGDHVPAFLLRPVRTPGRRTSVDSMDEADESTDSSEAA